jgi:hypothetical protein
VLGQRSGSSLQSKPQLPPEREAEVVGIMGDFNPAQGRYNGC